MGFGGTMRLAVLKWGIPAFVTVIGGTTAAVLTSGAAVPVELEQRAAAVLDQAGLDWATVRFDMRDAILTGTATDNLSISTAVVLLAETHGVRTVVNEAILAEPVSPYPFVITVSEGLLSLSGGVPDEAARSTILELAGQGAVDELKPMSGIPDRTAWDAAVALALAAARDLDEGEVALSDLELTVSGRARSFEAYTRLTATAPAATTAEIGYTEITPPLVDPFEWSARFDGARLELTGVTSDLDLPDRIQAMLPAGVTLESRLQLASGAPDGFGDTAVLLTENLLALESGSAGISGNTATLSGAPEDGIAAELVTTNLAAAGVALDLEPPRAAEYIFTATRVADGVSLSGLVPGADLRAALLAQSGVAGGELELARGAPAGFTEATELMLAALAELSEGRAELRGTRLSISGRVADARALETLPADLPSRLPADITLADLQLRPPLADPFTFSVRKLPGGAVTLDGHIADEGLRERLLETLSGAAGDRLQLADGAPEGFADAAVQAAAVVAALSSGSASFDGRTWRFDGAVDSPLAAMNIRRAIAAIGPGAASAEIELGLPAPREATLPIIDPYVWQGRKAANGTLTFSGFVPTPQMQRYLALQGGGRAVDGTRLGAGAPADFVANALAGLQALALLETGTVGLSNGTWGLSGTAADSAMRDSALEAVAAIADNGRWSIAVAPATASQSSPTVAADEPAVAPEVPDSPSIAAIDAAPVESPSIATIAPPVITPTEPNVESVADEVAAVESPEPPAMSAEAEVVPTTPTPPVEELAVAAVAEPAAAPAEPASNDVVAPSAPRDFVFSATKRLGEEIVFSGVVPEEPLRQHLAAISGTAPAEQLVVATGLPSNFIRNADVATRALAALSDGEFGLEDSRWVFMARAETAEAREVALAELQTAPDFGSWEAEITLLPPLDMCRLKVGALAGRNAILFQSGSARLAETSWPAIDELASYLVACPEADVNVEGHTDSDGDDRANLALSVARAETVVYALIDRGVSPDRLYAIGYGETLPIASNDTAAGKQANRRIGFALTRH